MSTPLTFNWSLEPSITTGGFTQDTGGINVGISYVNDGSASAFTNGSATQYVDTANGETFSTTSSLELRGNGNDGTAGDDQTSTTTVDFSAVSGSGFGTEVENVAFRINDFDTGSWTDVVTVRAFDANGVQIDVSLTFLGNTTTGINNGLTSTSVNGSAATDTGSILVQIVGPVSYIEIDYENDSAGAQALWVTDIHFDAMDLDGTVEGSGGDDIIDDTYILDPDGDKVDDGDAILPGYGPDGDLIEAYGGNDTVRAGAGDDTVYAGTGADSVSGGAGNDTVFLGNGFDTFGGGTDEAGNDVVYGGSGNDVIDAGADDDTVFGDDGDDQITTASGSDSLYGGDGSDSFLVGDATGTTTIEGGEDVGDGDIDTLAFDNSTSGQGVNVTMTGDEAGTFDFAGTTASGSFSEIEVVTGTIGDDTFDLTGAPGGATINAAEGADTIISGSGDDVVFLGADGFFADGDDQIVLTDGFGDDIIFQFEAPTDNGDGTFTGIDTLDVTGLSTGSVPVTVNDVTVTDDGSGNAVLNFPNGESVTLNGIDPLAAQDPNYLNAIGIPFSDGTVSGTAGADTIEVGYIGDPDGDLVDANDAILAGDTGNDDLIEAKGGDDIITAGAGNDEIYAGTGSDTINIDSNEGVDTIFGGEDAGDGDTDTLAFSDSSGVQGVDVTMTDNEAGTYEYPTDGGSGTFSDIENITLSDLDDTLDGAAATDGNTVDGGAGDDMMSGSSGQDSFDGGAGDDVLTGRGGQDTIEGGDGDDIISGDAAASSGTPTGQSGGQLYLDVANVRAGSETGTPGDAQEGDSVIFDNAATLPDGTIVSVRVTVASISDPGVTVDLTENQEGAPLRVNGNGDAANAGEEVQFVMEFFDQATGEPIIISGQATVTDIDDNGGAGEEYVSFEQADISDYTVSPSSSIVVDPSGNTLTGTGSTTNNASDEDAWFGVGFEESSQLTMTVGVVEFTANYGFSGQDITGGVTTELAGYDDSLSGGAGNDLIFGNGGDDVIDGGADDDTLYGGAGQDTLTGGTGADTLVGGADQDVIYGGAGDVVDGSEDGVDSDTLYVTGVQNIVYDAGNPENGVVTFLSGESLTFSNIENVVTVRDGTVSGTAGDDLINGAYTGDFDGDRVDNSDAIIPGDAPNDDLIEAGAGNDTIFAGLGDDEIYAGTGNDTVTAGSGNDTAYGEDGNDFLSGGTGNDTLFGGANNDTLNGGAGNDAMFGGDDDDRFIQESGFGTDTIEGGEGGTDNDEIWSTTSNDVSVTMTGDEAGTLSEGANTATFIEIESIETEDGNDTINLSADSSGMDVDSGAGNDTITGGTGNDSIDAGNGNDVVFANAGDNDITLGTGNDQVTLGTGNDTVYGGTGSDVFNLDDASGTNTVTGGEGNGGIIGDVLNSTADSDVTVTTIGDEAGTLTTGTTTVDFSQIEAIQTAGGDDNINLSNDTSGMEVSTGAGNDTIIGGSGDDRLDGGADDDSINGGAGADTLLGGTGNDTIIFADGDTASGDEGNDLFVLEDLGELGNGTITIDGGSGDESIDPDGAGPLTGGDTLQLGGLANLTQAVRDTFVDDGTGSFSGTITLDDGTILNFSEIENIICFTPGTRIATPRGLIAVDDLKVGELVVTRDHGLQPIRWIEGRTVPGHDRFAPVRIRKNVLSGQDRDLIVSPQHRVLFQGYRAELLFGESEVLVSAKHLIDGLDVTQDDALMVTYVHMMFDTHEIIYAEGAATESFHPGDIGFSAVGDAAREELFAIFPELRADPRHYGNTARRCLKSHEAKLMRT